RLHFGTGGSLSALDLSNFTATCDGLISVPSVSNLWRLLAYYLPSRDLINREGIGHADSVCTRFASYCWARHRDPCAPPPSAVKARKTSLNLRPLDLNPAARFPACRSLSTRHQRSCWRS